MLVNKAYKFRLYPNKEQEILINKTFGCSRLVYNNMLYKIKENNALTRFDMNKLIPSMYEEYPFVKEVDSCSLRCAVFDLINGLTRYNNKQGGYPNYKKKGVKRSYRTNNIRSEYKGKEYNSISIDLKRKIITLPKLKEVKIRGYRNLDKLEARVINATISKEGNKYYVSVVVSEEIKVEEKKTRGIVGIDLGVKTLVTTSDYEYYGNPKYLTKYEKRIKKIQKKLSRQVKESNNYKKTVSKLEEVYRKLKNARKKTAEEIVSKIVKNNDVIVIESLNIKRMTSKENKKKNLRKEILNSTFGKIKNILEYKCKWKEKILIKVSPYYSSSQICSNCNNKDESMKEINKREYRCKKCGNKIERDINASINLINEGIRLLIEKKKITE